MEFISGNFDVSAFLRRKFETDSINNAIVLPKLMTEKGAWKNVPHCMTYRTNAEGGRELGRVDRIASEVGDKLSKVHARPDIPGVTYEFRMENTGYTGYKGAYGSGNKRIVVCMKDSKGKWRTSQEVYETMLEEIGHAKSHAVALFNHGVLENGEAGLILSPKISKTHLDLIEEAISKTPDPTESPHVFDEWSEATKYVSDERRKSELVAKMYRQMKLNPEEVKKYLPQLYDVLKLL